MAAFANGDARTAYNTLELCVRSAPADDAGWKRVTPELLEDVLQRKMLRYDKAGEEHYNLISALHKSVRFGPGCRTVRGTMLESAKTH
jgi:putative ATPase